MPIWKPFIDWMAAWALPGLSKLTNPGGKAKKEQESGIRFNEEATTVWGYKRIDEDELQEDETVFNMCFYKALQ